MLSHSIRDEILSVAVLLALAVMGFAAEPAALHPKESLNWDRDVRSAWQTAQETQRPLLVFVTMDDCLFCQKMKKTTLQDRQVVSDLQLQFVPVAVNVKDQPDFVKLLMVKSFPTTVVILNNGDVIDSIAGYQTPKQLHERLLSTLRQAAREQRATVAR